MLTGFAGVARDVKRIRPPRCTAAALAEQLLASLDDIPEAETEQLWFAEAARRAAQIDSGAVQRIPGEQVRQEALARLR